MRASGELPLEGVLQAARAVLQDPQQQRQTAKRSYREAKESMDKEVNQGQEEREVRAGKEQNRTGHLKRELILQVSPSSHSYTIAEPRSTCQCWVASYFMLHKLREIRSKLQSIYNSLALCPLKATFTTNLKLKYRYTNFFIFPFYVKIILFSPKSSLFLLENYCRITLTSTNSPAHTSNILP